MDSTTNPTEMDTELTSFYDSLGSDIGTPTIEGPSPLEKIPKRAERRSQEELLDSPLGEGNIGTTPAVPMFSSDFGNISTARDRTLTLDAHREAQVLRIMEFERYKDTITAFSFTITTNRPAKIKNATDVLNLVKWICFQATDMDNKMNNENLYDVINWQQLHADAQQQHFNPTNTGADQLLLAIKVPLRFGFLTPAVVIVGDQTPDGHKDDKAILHFSDWQEEEEPEERMASIFIPCVGLSAAYIDLCTAAILSKLYGLGENCRRPLILAYPRRINTGKSSRQTAFIVIFTNIEVNIEQSEYDRMLQHAAIRNFMLSRFLDIDGNPVEHGSKITLLGPIHWILTSLSQHHFTSPVGNINEQRIPKVLQLNDCPFNWEQMATALSHATDISKVLFVSCTPEPAQKRYFYRVYSWGNLSLEVFEHQYDFRTTTPSVDRLLEKQHYPMHYSLTEVPGVGYYRAEQAWMRKFHIDLAQPQKTDTPPPPTTTPATPTFRPASSLTSYAQARATWQGKGNSGATGSATKPAGAQRTYAQVTTSGQRKNPTTPARASYTAHTTREPEPTTNTIVNASLLNQVVSMVENRLDAKNAAAEKVRADAASAKEAGLNATLKQMAETQSAIMQMLTHLTDPSPHKRNRPADAHPPYAPTLPFANPVLGEGTEKEWQSPPSSPAGASGFNA